MVNRKNNNSVIKIPSQDQDDSIFHRVEWYRVVLDEAHTIKSWMTQGAHAAFALLSHFRGVSHWNPHSGL